MKHYTEFLPKGLALDLQNAGMPIEWEDNSPDEHPNTEVHCLNTYAEAFDWLAEKGFYICIKVSKDGQQWHYFINGEAASRRSYDSWMKAAISGIGYVTILMEEGN